MPFCTYCGQSFTRDEHLERHILTHTNVKPYRCPSCYMSFARRDLLQRHYLVHGKDLDQQSGELNTGLFPKSAGRTPIACANCAKTKTKCDKKFPCSRCASRRLECTMRPARRTTKNHSARQHLERAAASSQVAPPLDNEADATSPSSATESPPQDTSEVASNPPGRLTHSIESKHSTMSPDAQTPGFQPQNITNGGTIQLCDDVFATASNAFEYSVTDGDAEMQSIEWPVFGSSTGQSVAHYTGIFPSPVPFESLSGAMALTDATGFMPMPNHEFEHSLSALNVNIGAVAKRPLLHEYSTSPLDGSKVLLGPQEADANDFIDFSDFSDFSDGWPLFQCDPEGVPPPWSGTARNHLERLQQGLQNHGLWATWSPHRTDAGTCGLEVVPLHEMARDKLLASSQRLLRRALDYHAVEEHGLRTPDASPSQRGYCVLPPNWILDLFLRSFAGGVEQHYALTSGGQLNADELVLNDGDDFGSLLVLLMIACGAQTAERPAALWLTRGLVETCRMPLYHQMPGDARVGDRTSMLHAGLLWTSLAAWSGDKWQMECASGMRDSHMALVRQLSVIEPGASARPAWPSAWPHVETSWTTWVRQEKRNRLVYAWVMLDHEMALFEERMPNVGVQELAAPLPTSDRLYRCRSADMWAHEWAAVHSNGDQPRGLRELFVAFLHDTNGLSATALTALQLRLLLQPLQALVSQYQQMRRWLGEGQSQAQLAEMRVLLQRWHVLADAQLEATKPPTAMQLASHMLFHLINLQTVASVAEIENMARMCQSSSPGAVRPRGELPALADVGEALFHAGRLLRLARSFERVEQQPAWWAAAVYRAALVLWAHAVLPAVLPVDGPTQAARQPNDNGPPFALDGPFDPLQHRYRSMLEGRPMLTRADGTLMDLGSAAGVLHCCQDLLRHGARSTFNTAIDAKLGRLARRSL